MSHPKVTSEGRIITVENDMHPLLVRESLSGLRRHPQHTGTPGSRFACVEDIEGVPMYPMEMSIWQHEIAMSYEEQIDVRSICDPPCDTYRDQEEDYVVMYTKYHAARCLESFTTDIIPYPGWNRDSLEDYLNDMDLKSTGKWGKHNGVWFCAVTDA